MDGFIGETLFVQVLEFVSWTGVARNEKRYGCNRDVRVLSPSELFGSTASAASRRA